MSVTQHEYHVSGTGIAADTTPSSGYFGWNDQWVPHMQGEVTIPLESVTDLAALDPRQTPAPRIQLSAFTTTPPNDSGGVTGVIRGRRISRKADTVTLRFAGRESELLDWGTRTGTSVFWNQGTVINLLRAVFDDATSEQLLIGGTNPQMALDLTDESAFIWAHGQGIWDFLDQVMVAQDMVLFDRGDSTFWYLRRLGETPEPQEYTIPFGAIIDRDEEIDRDAWADFARIDFTASDDAGTFQVVTPSQGTIPISNTWTGQSAFPKPVGVKERVVQWDSPKSTAARRDRAARRMRNRFAVLGEEIAATDVSFFELRPYQAVGVEQANGSVIQRVLSSVRHDIATQTMTVTARVNQPATT